jgi:hypothetical protein
MVKKKKEVNTKFISDHAKEIAARNARIKADWKMLTKTHGHSKELIKASLAKKFSTSKRKLSVRQIFNIVNS